MRRSKQRIYSITSSAPFMGAKAELRGTLQVTA
jgi:hypothetical protein